METYAASVLAQVQIAYGAAPVVAFVLVAIGTTLFGNLVAIPAILLGFHNHLGPNGYIAAPLAVLTGHLFGDAVWFTLGRYLAETRAGAWIRDRMPNHKRVQRFFVNNSVYILAASKLLAASTMPILFTLGWTQTDPRRYARLSLISAVIWFASALAFSGLLFSGIKIVF